MKTPASSCKLYSTAGNYPCLSCSTSIQNQVSNSSLCQNVEQWHQKDNYTKPKNLNIFRHASIATSSQKKESLTLQRGPPRYLQVCLGSPRLEQFSWSHLCWRPLSDLFLQKSRERMRERDQRPLEPQEQRQKTSIQQCVLPMSVHSWKIGKKHGSKCYLPFDLSSHLYGCHWC